MTSKARELRRRMSIDPDAPAPSPRRAARRPAATAPESETPPPEPTPDRAPADAAPAPSPAPDPGTPTTRKPTPTTSSTSAKDGPATDGSAKVEPARDKPAKPRAGSAAARGARRRGADAGHGWATALDDPAIDVDGNGYRSFYVNDAVFARFRAAVYWTARRPDATGVPDNMSTGVEEYMEEVAADLERRYNDGAVFRPTPDQLRAHRKRQS
ncbi:hypothetical protein [Actinomycetospora sp. CA-053990]|uniref:hypothetical protein n=1 Tax=Actinomycetospora sp. CA-053990 TaxID=3239891 RepID=UPI003D92EAAD